MTAAPANRPPLRLLHLEDNRHDAELIHASICEEWPASVIERVDTREGFITALIRHDFDLILSDFSMPAFNGLQALDIARVQNRDIPFIFLSGTIGEENAVLALQHGAVDYVMKDRPARLIPAIHRALALRHERHLRLAAERRMREQAGLLDKARDAICVTDLDGRMIYRNRSAARLLGWSVHQAQNRLLHALFKHSGLEHLDEALRQLHATGTWAGELRITDKDGLLRQIESRWTLVQDDASRPKAILLMNTDITEQKNYETQLLRAQRLEGIGTLAGGIAHDLNNTFSPILMAVTLLRDSLRDAKQLELLGGIESSARHGASLIRQLLNFARGADGERTEVQVRTVIRNVVTLLGDTLPRTIQIEFNTSSDLWPVHADSTQLVQVLMNLGINARDAMPKGGRLVFSADNIVVDEAITVANPGTRTGPHVRITVADTGTGIPPQLLDRIFDPFFTTKAAGKGTGLGLSTVLGIVKGHQGFVQVQSEAGRGTEFRIHLPAAPATATAPAPPPAPLAPVKGKGELILVIDDEPGVREMLSLVLRTHGYRVAVAANGSDGLISYRKNQGEIQAVVTDMMMPGLQGGEVIRELQRLNPDVRIVAMSGIRSELTALRRDPARLAILSKPMTPQELVQAIQAVLPSGQPA
ncbi:MAG: response regulator [Verrucomicrobiota bacterium]